MFEQQKIIEAVEKVGDALRNYHQAINERYRETSFNSMRTDRRYLRTQRLVAEIMQIVGPHLCEHEERHSAKDVYETLFRTFYDAGVEFLTDQDRQELGLPPRDVRGWTAQEIAVYDARMMEAMLSSHPLIVPEIEQPRGEKPGT